MQWLTHIIGKQKVAGLILAIDTNPPWGLNQDGHPV